MSHFLTFVTNENGVVMDESMSDDINRAMSDVFAFDHVYLYSHGWWQTEDAAMTDYNRFSVGYAAHCRDALKAGNAVLAGAAAAAGGGHVVLPQGALAVAVHWPSAVTEMPSILSNLLGAASFYTMEKRADDVGETGVYALLRQMLAAIDTTQRPIQINLIGHSFGTKVICAALAELYKQCQAAKRDLRNVKVRIVLLQAAFAEAALEPGKAYGEVAAFPDLKILVTRSQLDHALGTLFPFAQKMRFQFADTVTKALGFAGPTAATVAAFGGAQAVDVKRGDRFVGQTAFKGRLIVADLTQLHQADNAVQAGETKPRYTPGKESGNHSDIYNDEVYGLVARFLY